LYDEWISVLTVKIRGVVNSPCPFPPLRILPMNHFHAPELDFGVEQWIKIADKSFFACCGADCVECGRRI
jgi:hypothetical protein